MFELESPTKAKLLDVEVLSQKNRQPDENPGAKLPFELQLSNDMLVHFDGSLKSFLFTKNAASSDAKQGRLDVEMSDKPNLTGIGSKIGQIHWEQELTGYTLVIDQGLGGKRSNIEISDCTLSGWKLTPKEGGSVTVKVDIESADVSESAFGKLAKLKSREISITLTPPEVVQDDIEHGRAPRSRKGAAAAAPAPAPAPAASGSSTSDEGPKADAAPTPTPATVAQQRENWPFPTNGAKTDAQVKADGLAQMGEAAATPAASRPKRGQRNGASIGAVE